MNKPIKCRDKWRIRWLDETGARKSAVFDAYKDATAALARVTVEAAEIKAGVRDAPPPEKSFGDLCDYWIANRAPLKSGGGKDDISIIRVHLRPSFGALRLRDLGVEHFDQFKLDRQHLHKKTVLNLLTLLSTMLNLAVELRWLSQAPKVHKPVVRLFEKDFRYLRTDDEIRRFLTAARDEGDDTFAMYATAIFTGMREGEIAALRWDDVSFERRLIMVQRSFDGPTKSGEARPIPMGKELLGILAQWKLKGVAQLVFPNRDGNMHQPCARIFAERMHRVLDAAGFERPKTGRHLHVINFHSLRHTFASMWMVRSGDLFKLQRILGHQDIKMTQRYAHLAPHACDVDFEWMSGLAPVARPASVTQLFGMAK